MDTTNVSPKTIYLIKARRRDNLARLLDEHGKMQLSKLVDISADYLWQMGKGTGKSARGVSDDNARKIENALGKPPGWLDGSSQNAASPPVAPSATRPDYVRFPLLEGFAGMGRGDYVGDYPEIVEFVEVTREWATQKLRGAPMDAVRVITGRGDSMRGQYSDGDLIFLDHRVRQFAGDSAYCFRLHGRVQVKRLQLIGRDLVRVLSANPAYPPLDVALNDVEIGGRALAAWTLTEF